MDIRLDIKYEGEHKARICFDLDGVITVDPLGYPPYENKVLSKWTTLDWAVFFDSVVPNLEVISTMKELKNSGYLIKIDTARPTRFTWVTLHWLALHGVPFDDIHFGKPSADLYIDDKGIRFSSSHMLISHLKYYNLTKGVSV